MIDSRSPIPLYIQLEKLISDTISRGDYNPGDKLPSENDLCREYGVSRITVRQAMNLLVQKDLAFSVPGKGTFVKSPGINHELNRIVSFSKALQQKGLTGFTQIYSFEKELQAEEDHALLGMEVSKLNLIGYASNEPVVFYRSFLKPDIGLKMYEAACSEEKRGAAFSTYDLYDLIGVKLSKVEQTIRAANTGSELEPIMKIPKEKALIILESVYYSSEGIPLEVKTGYYRSDIYSFRLSRQV